MSLFSSSIHSTSHPCLVTFCSFNKPRNHMNCAIFRIPTNIIFKAVKRTLINKLCPLMQLMRTCALRFPNSVLHQPKHFCNHFYNGVFKFPGSQNSTNALICPASLPIFVQMPALGSLEKFPCIVFDVGHSHSDAP